MGPESNRKRAGMVALAAALIACALPLSAMARTGAVSPDPTQVATSDSGQATDTDDMRPRANGTYRMHPGEQPVDETDSPAGRKTDATDKPEPQRQPGVEHEPPGQVDQTTTTSTATTTTLPAHPTKQQGQASPKKAASTTTESSTTPTASTPTAATSTSTTTTTTTAPPVMPAEPEQEGRDESKTPNHASKQPAPPGQSKEKPSEPSSPNVQSDSALEVEVGQAEVDPAGSMAPSTRDFDWGFLTGDDQNHLSPSVPIERIEPKPHASSVVFSWLLESEAFEPSMAVVGPVLVLMTMWDAAASAGSGLAAPASGLGTFVLLILLDKTRLGDARLLRRGSEG